MKHNYSKFIFISLFASMNCYGAGIDALAPTKPKATPIATEAATDTEQPGTQVTPPDGKPAVATPPEKPAEGEAAQKQIPKSAFSKQLEDRLSLGTSVGWAVIKPAKGSWIGVGASDFSFQYRNSSKPDGNLYITGRYAPFAGVWTVNKRDYHTTLHGLYGGAEFHFAGTPLPSTTLKAGMELGYMMVYAKPQDHAEVASDVKGGKLNLTAGGGMDWSLLENKIRVGPFARMQFIGFTILNVGGSARFIF